MRFLFLLMLLAPFAYAADLPSEKVRTALFDEVVTTVERLDGEGLRARTNRPESWKATIRKLRAQARVAQTPYEFGHVFELLDSTYPNLHARMTLSPKYNPTESGRVYLNAAFGAEEIHEGQKEFSYRLSRISKDAFVKASESDRPLIGDELVKINGRSMKDWSRENFIFCKFPLREQCEGEIFDSFRKEELSWSRDQKLIYSLKRNGRTWDLEIPVDIPDPDHPAQASAADKKKSSASPVEKVCRVKDGRYDAWNLAYQGWNVRVFENPKFQNTAVIRIPSFRYVEAEEEKLSIPSIQEETRLFYEKYWKMKAPQIKTVIFDVLDNHGGDETIEWYRLFFSKPFQDESVQFRKIREFDAPSIRKELFYGDRGKDIWLDELVLSGAYAKIKFGDFLPPVPQFCPHHPKDEERSCQGEKFEPLPHGFRGDVKFLVNSWCVSSCTGFLWTFKQALGEKVKLYGFPDSGDSAYGRVFLDAILDPKEKKGYRLQIAGRRGGSLQKTPEGSLFRWQVSVTRSTDENGKITSAIPSQVDEWVPIRFHYSDNPWKPRSCSLRLKAFRRI